MPFVLKNHGVTTLLSVGVWKMDESLPFFRKAVLLDPAEEELLASFKNETRKKQWLCYRLIIQELLGSKGSSLKYDNFGKPYFSDTSMAVSVSHSGEFAAVILSNSLCVGIDVEKIRDRVERIKERFLSVSELNRIGSENRLEKLYIHWGAKESLYKIHGRPEVDFINDISIEPFDYLCTGEGSCKAWMRTPGETGIYEIIYRKIDEYMLVYAVKI
jgi:4'-phosphopantetheinyl transferase